MDPNLMLWWTLFLLAVVLDVMLWVAGFLLNVGPAGRYRLNASAVLLLSVVLGMMIGWGLALGVVAAGLWIYAICLGIFSSLNQANA